MLRRSLGMLLLVLIATAGSAQDPAERYATEVRSAALAPNGMSGDPGKVIVPYPLPLAAHWHTGKPRQVSGMTPDYQLRLLEHGRHVLLSLQFPDISAMTEDPSTGTYQATAEGEYWNAYWRNALNRAATLDLPIALVATQWERLLTERPVYTNQPPQASPVVTVDNQYYLSPFGPIEAWREVGRAWATSPLMVRLQAWYPNPKLVILLSNNEAAKLHWTQADYEPRYFAAYPSAIKADGQNVETLPEEEKQRRRRAFREGWERRYRALQEGMRGGLTSAWRESIRFVGYDAFAPSYMGLWDGWQSDASYETNVANPYATYWDGSSSSYYLHNWMPKLTDYSVRSPQIESMNWVPVLERARAGRRHHWFEMSVWDGHIERPTPTNPDKRTSMEGTYSPERHQGFVQFGMWLLRPRVVREFRLYEDSVSDMERYYYAILGAVDRVWEDPILRDFWQYGTLVPNPRSHPYKFSLPAELREQARNFLCDTTADPKWSLDALDAKVEVFSLALERQTANGKEWLVYAYAPLAKSPTGVIVTIPGTGKSVQMSVSEQGTFTVVR